jgi:hypothetical protein
LLLARFMKRPFGRPASVSLSLRSLLPLLPLLSLLPLAALSACSAAPGDPSATATTSEAIIDGTPVTNDMLGEALLMYCPNGQAGCNYSAGAAWGCSGTMVADRWFLTARHCVQTNDSATVLGTPIPAADALVYEPYGATWAVGQAIFQHPTLDVALVFLSSSIDNEAGQAYWTPIYAGTSAGLVGRSLYCEGYGIDVAGNSSTYGTLRSAMMTPDTGTPGFVSFPPNGLGQVTAGGDSGGACFLSAPGGSTQNYVVSVHSDAEYPLGTAYAPSEDYDVGADGFRTWAISIVAQNACSQSGATCGSVTDGFGTVVSCGTCAADDVCSANRCVCAPKTCPGASTWDPATCSCKLPCHTAASCCIAAGGYWDGKYCE